jgi:hypothetical protein
MKPTENAEITNSAMLGLERLTDNHGNRFEKHVVTCAHKKPVAISYDAEVWLLKALTIHEHFSSFVHSGVDIPMVFGLESPLQTVCRKLDAEAHQAPAASPKARAK